MSEEPEPVEIPKELPKTLTASRKFGDQLFVAGAGPRPARLMFVATSVLEDEHQDYIQHSYGRRTKDPARYLKGSTGSILSNLTNAVGLDMDGCYYTALIKWLAPKARRLRPTKEMIQAATELLYWEIQQTDPDIIVCMGKPVFDLLSGTKFKLHDIAGGWFQAEIGGRMRRLYPMECVTRPVLKPEYTERFRTDLREVRRMFERVDGVYVESYEQHYETISTATQLEELVNRLEAENRRVLSVDCEWHGPNHIDGQLRSLQICWAPGYAAYIRFMDDQLNYALDVPYDEAGRILSRWLDRPEVKYVGHHISADLPWMSHVLGLEWYDKTMLDTEFAQQCVEESSEVGLERLCMGYTDLGRWDIPIELWKKRNPGKTKDGYGLIPDDVLIPYACLRTDSLVQLSDGSWEQIGKLVRSKYGGCVKAMLDGRVVDRPVTGWHRHSVRQKEWRKIRTLSSADGRWGLVGPAFTPDHKVMTLRGKVEVQHLVPGEDRIYTDERRFSPEQMSILLGSLMGDGGVTQRNNGRAGFTCSQCDRRKDYALWKYRSLFPDDEAQVTDTGTHTYCRSPYKSQVLEVMLTAGRKSSEEHRERHIWITREVLEKMGPLGFAVWYQDDGVYAGASQAVRSTTLGQPRISSRRLTEGEIDIVSSYLSETLGAKKDDIGYYKSQGVLRINGKARRKFLDWIHPYMHPVFAYKTYKPVTEVFQPALVEELYAEPILNVETANRGKEGDGVRYCLSVDEAENFLTPIGFVSNCSDTDGVMRSYPHILRRLAQEHGGSGLIYYQQIFNPFVTNIFTSFVLYGLPVDMKRIDHLRDLYQYMRGELHTEFLSLIATEAEQMMESKLDQLGCGPDVWENIQILEDEDQMDEAERLLYTAVQAEQHLEVKGVWEQFKRRKVFNINSPHHIRPWLFEAKGMMPVKSTNQKEKGLPSMPWEKVLELPKEKQREFTPSSDSQTLEILGQTYKDPVLKKLLEFKSVNNVAKTFLGEPVKDEETGEVLEERGLHGFITREDTIVGLYGATETGRPRLTKISCEKSLLR